MIKNIKDLISSYLTLKELLGIYKLEKVDLILKNLKVPDIYEACGNGDLKVVKFLMEKGIIPTSDAVNYACFKNQFKIAKYLIEKGINPSPFSINWASHNGNIKLVKFLVNKGIRPQLFALQWACEYGHLEVLKYLFELVSPSVKLPINIIDIISKKGYFEIVELLKTKGY